MKIRSRAVASLVAAASASRGGADASTTTYEPLSCNVDIDSCDASSAAPLSTLVAAAEATNSSSHVVVPCNSCAYVDYSDGSVVTLPNGIDVAGRLIFPPSANVELRTRAVFVQGALDVAVPDGNNRVTVSLYGEEEVRFYPHEMCGGTYDSGCEHGVNVGFKPIVVAGGKLNIDAIDPACPSWTRLLYKVSNTKLRVDPDFAACLFPGDQILVTSSTTEWDGDKMADVAFVDPTEGIVELETPIAEVLPGAEKTVIPSCFNGIDLDGTYCCASLCGTCGGSGCSGRPGGAYKCCTSKLARTCANVYDTACRHEDTADLEYVDGEYAVEVARLSRAVTFTSTVEDDVGGHLIIFHTSVEQHISGIRIENFGQSGILGRYPIHFHMCGPSPGSIVAKNVIADSNQRCVFIHGTDQVTVEDNVAHNTLGHCYATETGNESNNKFLNNLAARTKKLHKSNGQSDSPNFMEKHIAASFWVRSAMNEWANNVAAGSQVQGFWLEMSDKKSDQLFEMAFRDNVAHSNAEQGLTTYRPGWTPANGGIVHGFKAYRNGFDGLKFHATDRVTVRDSLLADNRYHVRYGAFNGLVTLSNTTVDAMSTDYRYRLNGGSDERPHTERGIYASVNGVVDEDPVPDSLALRGVTFRNFNDARTIEFYFDDRNYNARGFGDPVHALDLKFENSAGDSYPYFNCGLDYYHSFLEDVEGTLISPDEPSHGQPGFIVAGREGMTAFLPKGSCDTISYSGSNSYQQDGCSYYCTGVCLRSVEIEPRGNGHAYAKMRLVKEDGKEWTMAYNGRNKDTERIFFLVLPAGNYTGEFYDENDAVVDPEWVDVAGHTVPECDDVVSVDSFAFDTTGAATEFCHRAATADGDVCCSERCGGMCGGPNCCNLGSGGCDGCCAGRVRSSGRVCEHFYDTQCVIPPEESA